MIIARFSLANLHYNLLRSIERLFVPPLDVPSWFYEHDWNAPIVTHLLDLNIIEQKGQVSGKDGIFIGAILTQFGRDYCICNDTHILMCIEEDDDTG